MTYEEAVKVVAELNQKGWALTITQNLDRKVRSEFSAGFVHHTMAFCPGEMYGDTIPDAIAAAARRVEEHLEVTVPDPAHDSDKR